MTKDEKRELYVRYMQLKIEERDWHGVSDAANDLRELELQNEIAVSEDNALRFRRT